MMSELLETRTKKELMTDEFLATLAETGKRSGWNNDYQEVASFILECFELAGKDAPDLEPYPARQE